MMLVVVALVIGAGYVRFGEAADMTAIISGLTRPFLPLT
jgi:hypothetical protein